MKRMETEKGVACFLRVVCVLLRPIRFAVAFRAGGNLFALLVGCLRPINRGLGPARIAVSGRTILPVRAL